MGLFCACYASENSSALQSQYENNNRAWGTEQPLSPVMSACIEKSEETDWFSRMGVPTTVHCNRRSVLTNFMSNIITFTF